MIYLDHHAATPLSDPARAEMTSASFGNPASAHAIGRRARQTLERARARVAASVGADVTEVVLTSGGTEACNAMVLGLGAPRRILSSALEHPAVAAALPLRGVEVVLLPVEPGRALSVEAVDRTVRAGDLVVVQHASHETGVIAEVAAIAEVVRARGGWTAVDAVAAYGRIPVRLDSDALALASHKVGGPPGAGALVIRRGVAFEPRMVGGGQERGRRGGSPDVAAMAGFGAAAEDINRRLAAMAEVERSRDRLEAALVALGARVNGEGPRTASVTHVSVPGWRGAELVAALDLEGVACSAGAACSSGLATRSPALEVWYPDDPARASGTLRLSLGPETSPREVDAAIEALRRVLARASRA